MQNNEKRSLDHKLNTWMQIVMIVIAAIRASTTFVYKEYFVPEAAPINKTLNLQLKRPEENLSSGNIKLIGVKAQFSTGLQIGDPGYQWIRT